MTPARNHFQVPAAVWIACMLWNAYSTAAVPLPQPTSVSSSSTNTTVDSLTDPFTNPDYLCMMNTWAHEQHSLSLASLKKTQTDIIFLPRSLHLNSTILIHLGTSNLWRPVPIHWRSRANPWIQVYSIHDARCWIPRMV